MIKREVIIILVVTVFLTLNSIAQDTTVPTTLEIIYNNIAPLLLSNIPNQTWVINHNNTNAFDLDNYFLDNETLTYNATVVQNITIIINSTTNVVSFYPDYNFYGLRNVTFTASDTLLTTDSNVVFLNVTQDTRPPTWSSQSALPINVYQNSIVTFSTQWQDDFGLGSYILSLNQLGTWVNYSAVSFSGTQNTSSMQIQIAAPGGSNVSWQYFGFDESNNMNMTEILTFEVNSTPTSASSSSSSSEESSSSESTPTRAPSVQKKLDYIIEPTDSYTLEIKQGESGTITFKITNTGNTDLDFSLEVEDLNEFTNALSLSNFSLTAGESKTITAEFTAPEKILPDIYFGKIKVKTQLEDRDIFVAVIVKQFVTDLEVDVLVPEEYKIIRQGETVKANITISNLKDFRERNITFYYSINGFTGRVIDSAHEQFTMKSQNIVLEKELSVPDNTYIGDYIFFARAVTEEEIAIDGDTFEVGEKFNVQSLIRSNLILLIIILLSALIAILMLRRHKNKERLRLLNLYMMVTELNKLMKDGKTEEAIDLYVRIKSTYSEPVAKTAIRNREDLKKEMVKLSEELNLKIFSKQVVQENQKTQEADKDKITDTNLQNKKEEKDEKPTEKKADDKK